MKIFITGINGQLGTDLRIVSEQFGHIVKGCGRKPSDETWYRQINIAKNYEDLLKEIKLFNPDVIVHCAAWTAVDLAETQQKATYESNVIASKNISNAAKEIGCKLIYISSDYVYGVSHNKPILESDNTEPLSYYGKTKLLGEEESLKYDKSFVLRVSWLHGQYGNNFPKTMIALSKDHSELKVVDDQIGRPTNTADLSKLILEIADSDKYGVYNVCNEGPNVSWKEFAEYVLRNSSVKVVGVSSEEYYRVKSGANRPLNSRLSTVKLKENGFTPLPDWRLSLSYVS